LLGLDTLGLPTLVHIDMVWGLLAAPVLYAIALTLIALLVEQLSFRRYRGMATSRSRSGPRSRKTSATAGSTLGGAPTARSRRGEPSRTTGATCIAKASAADAHPGMRFGQLVVVFVVAVCVLCLLLEPLALLYEPLDQLLPFLAPVFADGARFRRCRLGRRGGLRGRSRLGKGGHQVGGGEHLVGLVGVEGAGLARRDGRLDEVVDPDAPARTDARRARRRRE
jgi:hypothetical protein